MKMGQSKDETGIKGDMGVKGEVGRIAFERLPVDAPTPCNAVSPERTSRVQMLAHPIRNIRPRPLDRLNVLHIVPIKQLLRQRLLRELAPALSPPPQHNLIRIRLLHARRLQPGAQFLVLLLLLARASDGVGADLCFGFGRRAGFLRGLGRVGVEVPFHEGVDVGAQEEVADDEDGEAEVVLGFEGAFVQVFLDPVGVGEVGRGGVLPHL